MTSRIRKRCQRFPRRFPADSPGGKNIANVGSGGCAKFGAPSFRLCVWKSGQHVGELPQALPDQQTLRRRRGLPRGFGRALGAPQMLRDGTDSEIFFLDSDTYADKCHLTGNPTPRSLYITLDGAA